ncbi:MULTISPECIES: ribosome-inactivating family protein [unclassified Curtobacterium]|uniref:ribosome-inactivating family protein n=1 Tax=unclassified Curtobacterium TaxID=257496 RepID=UPI0015E8CF51|nr:MULTISPECIES: ribosome-inactivating family protein [unclassified Curtobacterium]
MGALTMGSLAGGAEAASAQVPDPSLTLAGSLDLNDYASSQVSADYNRLVGALEDLSSVRSWDGGFQTQNGGGHGAIITAQITAHDSSGNPHALTLYFHAENLYLAGIRRAGDPAAYFFSDDQGWGGGYVSIGLAGNYNALTQAAGRGRSAMPISWNDINASVLQLATAPGNYSAGIVPRQATARSLLLLIQMFSEAARFPAIQAHFANALYNNSRTNGLTLGEEHLENNWSALSSYSYAQHHNQNPAPITITGNNGSTYAYINTANAVRRYVRILLGSSGSAASSSNPSRAEL